MKKLSGHLHNLNLIQITECFTNPKAACVALRNGAAFVKNRGIYQERRDTLVDGFRTFGWNVDKPAGSMFVWAEIPKAGLL